MKEWEDAHRSRDLRTKTPYIAVRVGIVRKADKR
jgi:hypothetical protein